VHVLEDTLRQSLEQKIRSVLTQKILNEHRFEALVEDRMSELKRNAADTDLNEVVNEGLQYNNHARWSKPLEQFADKLVKGE
jgi:uncharacterized protein YpuA (DUF1002 family)